MGYGSILTGMWTSQHQVYCVHIGDVQHRGASVRPAEICQNVHTVDFPEAKNPPSAAVARTFVGCLGLGGWIVVTGCSTTWHVMRIVHDRNCNMITKQWWTMQLDTSHSDMAVDLYPAQPCTLHAGWTYDKRSEAFWSVHGPLVLWYLVIINYHQPSLYTYVYIIYIFTLRKRVGMYLQTCLWVISTVICNWVA